MLFTKWWRQDTVHEGAHCLSFSGISRTQMSPSCSVNSNDSSTKRCWKTSCSSARLLVESNDIQFDDILNARVAWVLHCPCGAPSWYACRVVWLCWKLSCLSTQAGQAAVAVLQLQLWIVNFLRSLPVILSQTNDKAGETFRKCFSSA